jgi:hypothetical protein
MAWGVVSLSGCDETAPTSPIEELSAANGLAAAASQTLDPALCAIDRPGYTLGSENDFFPLGVGSWWKFRGQEDGTLLELRITVLNQTEEVGGVTTRVVEEREWEDGDLLEVSLNYYAEASDGTVCYFGEAVDIYDENGDIVSHDGAWRADDPGNAPGIFMPSDPEPGMTYQMERAPGIAEDTATIRRSGRVRVPAGTFRETIRVSEFNPLDGGTGTKIFAEDAGLIIDGPVTLRRYFVADDGD